MDIREVTPGFAVSPQIAVEDIKALAENRKFRDCAHQDEPGCAVLEALEAGEISEDRLQNYLRMVDEIAHRERKRDASSTSDEKKRRRKFSKMQRRYRKDRNKS